ncbi:pentapeptide repeat-containing protein [Crocosphaera sp.]|uniref:pentapeptide repeat-containing protein n=1 Tax=Crocosphaera sp. TaxID=2729996 RepID=UPI003F20ED6E
MANNQKSINDNNYKQKILDEYLKTIGNLLIEEKLTSEKSQENARHLAQALTINVLLELDHQRKQQAIDFLSNAKLLEGDNGLLKNANFMGCDLENINFRKANLEKSNLKETNLKSSNLKGTNLKKANLEKADMRKTILGQGVIMYGVINWGVSWEDQDGTARAIMESADLSKANLKDANLRESLWITPEQIKQAYNWETGKYDPEFRKTLGL